MPSLCLLLALFLCNFSNMRGGGVIRSFVTSIPHRLKTIIDMIPPGSIVADIGADHGILSVSLLNNAKKVYSVELSPLAASNGVSKLVNLLDSDKRNKIEVLVGDGVTALLEVKDIRNVDTLVMAGMGSISILQILVRDNKMTLDCTPRLRNLSHLSSLGISQIILQIWPPNLLPMLKLTRFLMDNSWICHQVNIFTVRYL
jgi:Methyltransferase domain